MEFNGHWMAKYMIGAPAAKMIKMGFAIGWQLLRVRSVFVLILNYLIIIFESALMHFHSHPNELILQVKLTPSWHPNLRGRPVAR